MMIGSPRASAEANEAGKLRVLTIVVAQTNRSLLNSQRAPETTTDLDFIEPTMSRHFVYRQKRLSQPIDLLGIRS